MNFELFKLLELSAQAQVICENGALLAERTEDNYLIILYQVDSFYVEVYYHQHNDEIVKFRSFHSVKFLEPYLQNINVRSLVQHC